MNAFIHKTCIAWCIILVFSFSFLDIFVMLVLLNIREINIVRQISIHFYYWHQFDCAELSWKNEYILPTFLITISSNGSTLNKESTKKTLFDGKWSFIRNFLSNFVWNLFHLIYSIIYWEVLIQIIKELCIVLSRSIAHYLYLKYDLLLLVKVTTYMDFMLIIQS